ANSTGPLCSRIDRASAASWPSAAASVGTSSKYAIDATSARSYWARSSAMNSAAARRSSKTGAASCSAWYARMTAFRIAVTLIVSHSHETSGTVHSLMITVHHLERSRSHRILWLLEELEVPYQIVRYARDPKTILAPPELQKIHPLGKSPVVTDGDTTVAESGAILEYLVERHGGGRLAPRAG